MELYITYNEIAEQTVAAGFIPGDSPLLWLQEMASWQVPVGSLQCYAMPKSIGDNSLSGLFVVFGQQSPRADLLRYPYTSIAGRIFIPLNARLMPECSDEELKRLTLWDVQVIHPQIGAVGFEKADAIQLAPIIALQPEKPADWGHAHPPQAGMPHLRSVGLEPLPGLDDMMESLRDEIGSKPLDEISEGKKEIPWGDAGRMVGITFLYVLLYPILLISAILGFLFGPLLRYINFEGHSRPGKIGGPNPLHKAISWINQRLDDLQKERGKELDRLLGLFDTDVDEALKYAIPFGNMYENRGTAPPSSRLNKHGIDFNLGGLGGGQRVDNWNVDSHAQALRQKYNEAANAAIAAGKFKRAAYIYAHLLGNYHMAANVLQQGGLWYEAAIIHKDHLKNPLAAAESFEKGGFLNDAITIYIELKRKEKVAELYEKLGDEDNAAKYYSNVIEDKLAVNDYIGASNLTLNKLNRRNDALDLLMEGWHNNASPENCLINYIELATDGETDDRQVLDVVNEVYHRHVSAAKKTTFMNVLADMQKRYPEQLEGKMMPIVYDIVNSQLQYGDSGALKQMPQFVANDALLRNDVNRFINHNTELLRELSKVTFLNTRPDVKMGSMVRYQNDFVGLGYKDNHLYVIRANAAGKLASRALYHAQNPSAPLWLITEPDYSDCVLIAGSHIEERVDKTMDNAFGAFATSFHLKTLEWLGTSCMACCIAPEGCISAIHYKADGLYLAHYNMHGTLRFTHDCVLDGKIMAAFPYPFRADAMVYRDGYYYFIIENLLVRFDQKGQGEAFGIFELITGMAVTTPGNQLRIALLSSAGCQLVQLADGAMQPLGDTFSSEIGATHALLLPNNTVALANDSHVSIFEIVEGTPVKQYSIQSDGIIRQLFAGEDRQQIGLLTNRGAVLYSVPKS